MTWVGAVTTQELAGDERFARRHHLSLRAQASIDGSGARVVIHNLSTTGLLIEADLALEVGDVIDVDLPEAGTTRAEVLWRSEDFYGCEFINTLSTGVVSAARLRSQPAALVPAAQASLAEPVQIVPEIAVPARPDADPNAMSPRRKLAIIGGLALACWIPIIAAVWALV
jgi:hypothetical protein